MIRRESVGRTGLEPVTMITVINVGPEATLDLEPPYIKSKDVGAGGDGGESNSPSSKSCPEYTTSLVSYLISPGKPLLTEFSQASR